MLEQLFKKLYCLLIILIVISLMGNFLYSAYTGGVPGIEQRQSIDAGMAATAGSSDALSDDVSSIYYNSAGLSHIKKNMLLGSYLPLWDSSTYAFFVGTSFKTEYFPMLPFGIGILSIVSEDIKISYNSPIIAKIGNYQNTLLLLSAGYKIVEELSIGIRLNFIYQSILDYDDWGTGVDLSLLWRAENLYSESESKLIRIIKPISLGVTVYNILPPAIQLKETEEKFPLMFKAGLSYRIHQIINLLDIEPVIGVESVPEYDVLNLKAGIELGLWKAIYIRSGYKITEKQFTIGTGFNIRNIAADYGMTFLGIKKNLYVFNIKVKF